MNECKSLIAVLSSSSEEVKKPTVLPNIPKPGKITKDHPNYAIMKGQVRNLISNGLTQVKVKNNAQAIKFIEEALNYLNQLEAY